MDYWILIVKQTKIKNILSKLFKKFFIVCSWNPTEIQLNLVDHSLINYRNDWSYVLYWLLMKIGWILAAGCWQLMKIKCLVPVTCTRRPIPRVTFRVNDYFHSKSHSSFWMDKHVFIGFTCCTDQYINEISWCSKNLWHLVCVKLTCKIFRIYLFFVLLNISW